MHFWQRLRRILFGRTFIVDMGLLIPFMQGFTPKTDDMYEQLEDLAEYISKLTKAYVFMRAPKSRFTFYVRCLDEQEFLQWKLTWL